MPLQGPVTMSLSTKIVAVTHTSIASSPASWNVYSISTPGATGLRKARWTFSAPAPDAATGFNIANLSLGPAIVGNAMDNELTRLAAIGEQIVLKVSFNGSNKEDLPVNLLP